MCLVWHPEATYLSVIKSNTTTYNHLCNTKGCQLVLGSIIIFVPKLIHNYYLLEVPHSTRTLCAYKCVYLVCLRLCYGALLFDC